MSKPDSNAVARALFIKVIRYARKLEKQKTLSGAQKRHLLKIKTVKALRDGNWELDR